MQPDPIDREQAAALQKEILSLPGVARMHPGRYGEVAMLFPNERVEGLHVTTAHPGEESQRLEVWVTADGSDLPDLNELADTIRSLAGKVTDLPVDVTIGDIAA